MELPVIKYTALLALWSILDHPLDLNKALQDTLNILASDLSTTRAGAIIDDPKPDQAPIIAVHDPGPVDGQQDMARLVQNCSAQAVLTRSPFLIQTTDELIAVPGSTSCQALVKQAISFFGAPILADNSCAGLILVDRLFPEGVPWSEDLVFLQDIAAIIGRFLSLQETLTHNGQSRRLEQLPGSRPKGSDDESLELVCSSQAMQHVWQDMERVAPTRTTVLLQGESGVGKTRIARIIHQLSGRPGHAFVTLNCASLQDTPLTSELFGFDSHVLAKVPGSGSIGFPEAVKGTLFLKDVSDLPLSIQARVLEAVQEQSHERPPTTSLAKPDIRIIASASRDLAEMCTAGHFRADLFYRLNVFPIQVPPLRERREDLPELLHQILSQLCTRYGRKVHLSPRALKALKEASWPGNIKEVKVLLERMVIMVQGECIELQQVKDLLHSTLTPKMGEGVAAARRSGEKPSLEDTERSEILAALRRNFWSQRRAAAELGISPRQMGYRVRKFNLRPIIAQGKADLRRDSQA